MRKRMNQRLFPDDMTLSTLGLAASAALPGASEASRVAPAAIGLSIRFLSMVAADAIRAAARSVRDVFCNDERRAG
jgi:hypothetical protein